MPQTNYDNSFIYKLCCKNTDIKDEYVGSTTNKRSRKSNHKLNCSDQNRKDYNLRVYQFIRENGGWENWQFIILEKCEVSNVVELRLRERHFIELLRPTLNKLIPTRTQKEYDYVNREKIKEYRSKYYEENKSEIIRKNCERQKKRILCESCNIEIAMSSLSHHKKSEGHINNLNL